MLDVFAVQVRMRGLLFERDWAAARRLADAPPADALERALDPDARRAAQQAAARLEVTPAAAEALRDAIARLRTLAPPGTLSDRTFGPAAVRLMRAHAWLRGAPRVDPEDVAALRYTFARRVPSERQAEAAQLLREVAAPVAGAGAEVAAGAGGAGSSDEPVAPPVEVGLDPRAEASDAPDAEIVALIEALEGRMGRGPASRREDPGGSPRSWRRLRGLEELLEADPADAWLWASGCSPEPPRVPRRERRDRGGAVAVLRDVSASMEGRLGAWAGDVVCALAAFGRRRRMKLGYVEFNHAAERFSHASRFFHGRYDAIAALGARRRCEGRTSYQAPLAVALDELARTPERERHIVLLTDGVPVVGDPQVTAERAAARRLGVRVHTVFLGTGPRPEVLDRLALETGGLGFRARPRAGRGIRVEVACTSA
jgi:Mg-chelatase subunit ChlD